MANQNISPPLLQPDLPNYPLYPQFVRIRASSSSSAGGPASTLPNGVYAAFVQQYFPDFSFRDREACYVFEVTRAELDPGIYYCRLVGSYNNLPVYATVCCAVADPQPACNVSVDDNDQVITQETTSITITGSGFDAVTLSNNIITFGGGLGATGTVTAATATQLTITFGTLPASGGELTVTVTVGACSDTGRAAYVAPTEVAAVCGDCQEVNTNYCVDITGADGFCCNPATTEIELVASILENCVWSGSTLICGGSISLTVTLFFDEVAWKLVVVSGGTTLNVTYTGSGEWDCGTNLVMTLDGAAFAGLPCDTWPATLTVTPGPCCDVDVDFNDADLLIDSTIVTIHGTGFSTTPGNNTVVFNLGATGTVTAATATQLTVTFGTSPSGIGALTAIVTVDQCDSGAAVQVATVIQLDACLADTNCVCGALPTTLCLTGSNQGGCSCVDGLSITLTTADNITWTGTASGVACLGSGEWDVTFCCTGSPNYQLIITDTGTGVTTRYEGVTDATCAPLALLFQAAGEFFGCTGTARWTIEECGGVQTDCCVETIPEVLLCTISGTTGACGCLPATVTLTHSGGWWTGSGSSGCDIDLTLECVAGVWTLSSVGCVFSISGESSEVCSPLELVFSGVTLMENADCCNGTATFTITPA